MFVVDKFPFVDVDHLRVKKGSGHLLLEFPDAGKESCRSALQDFLGQDSVDSGAAALG